MARKLPYNVVDAAVDDLSFLPEQWRQLASKQLVRKITLFRGFISYDDSFFFRRARMETMAFFAGS